MANSINVLFNLQFTSAELVMGAAKARTELARLQTSHGGVTASSHRLASATSTASRAISHLGAAFTGLHSGVGTAISGIMHLGNVFAEFRGSGMMALGGLAVGATALGMAFAAAAEWTEKSLEKTRKLIEESKKWATAMRGARAEQAKYAVDYYQQEIDKLQSEAQKNIQDVAFGGKSGYGQKEYQADIQRIHLMRVAMNRWQEVYNDAMAGTQNQDEIASALAVGSQAWMMNANAAEQAAEATRSAAEAAKNAADEYERFNQTAEDLSKDWTDKQAAGYAIEKKFHPELALSDDMMELGSLVKAGALSAESAAREVMSRARSYGGTSAGTPQISGSMYSAVLRTDTVPNLLREVVTKLGKLSVLDDIKAKLGMAS